MPFANQAVGVAGSAVNEEQSAENQRKHGKEDKSNTRMDQHHIDHDADKHKYIGDGPHHTVGDKSLKPVDVGCRTGQQCPDRCPIEMALVQPDDLLEETGLKD